MVDDGDYVVVAVDDVQTAVINSAEYDHTCDI